MLSAEFIDLGQGCISGITVLEINRTTVLRAPDYRLLVSDHGIHILYVDIYFAPNGESACFSDINIHQRCIIVGCGESVHFIFPDPLIIKSAKLADYFGSFYPLPSLTNMQHDNCLLVCSASRLYCFSYMGDRIWLSANLAIDGVIVHRIEAGYIYGIGECDPPGGWQPFCLNIDTGKLAR